jgi:hypothetical protein
VAQALEKNLTLIYGHQLYMILKLLSNGNWLNFRVTSSFLSRFYIVAKVYVLLPSQANQAIKGNLGIMPFFIYAILYII